MVGLVCRDRKSEKKWLGKGGKVRMLVALAVSARAPWDSSHGPTNPSIEWLVASKITWYSGVAPMHGAQMIGRRETTRLCRACPAFSMSSCFKFYDRLDFLGRLRYIEGSYHSPTAHLVGRRGGKARDQRHSLWDSLLELKKVFSSPCLSRANKRQRWSSVHIIMLTIFIWSVVLSNP